MSISLGGREESLSGEGVRLRICVLSFAILSSANFFAFRPGGDGELGAECTRKAIWRSGELSGVKGEREIAAEWEKGCPTIPLREGA